MAHLLLGYDVGSSSIKAALLDADDGRLVASAVSPKTEMEILAPRPGWAEQRPESWWEHVVAATREIAQTAAFDPAQVAAIGISYQMHGLVAVDKQDRVVRPAIIWCDGRAVPIGERAARDLGPQVCLERCLNLPGNFTASKLRWVKENEPEVFARIAQVMLPGDYIAMRMTDEIRTTVSGFSEGIFWDFRNERVADFLLDYYELSPSLLPPAGSTFSIQGELTREAADTLGLRPGIPIAYRAGDQPNNALSLNVLNPGEAAVTAGTSGVVYGILDRTAFDPQSRVNTFAHVNHALGRPRYGVLLCLNGTGILNSWIKHNLTGGEGSGLSYERMNELAATAPVGSAGLAILPYGNGAERTLGNRDPGASVHGWRFNLHARAHFLRAAQEGIVFALSDSLGIMRAMGMEIATVRAGHANMFLSPLFAEAFATVVGAAVELYNTDGAQGAARGAGLGAGIYRNEQDAFAGLRRIRTVEPNPALAGPYAEAFDRWKSYWHQTLNRS